MRPEHWLFTIPLRLRSLFRWAQADKELDDELRDHLERKAEEYVAKGMAPAEARRGARLDLGGIEQTKEKCRDARRVNWFQDLIQDTRYGLRILRKSPGFTVVAVLTLSLGIGANTAIFSLLNAVMLQSIPVRHPEQLVILRWSAHRQPENLGTSGYGDCLWVPGAIQSCSFSYPLYRAVLAHTDAFSSVLAMAGADQLDLSGNGATSMVVGELVSGNYFETLGVPSALGRTIQPLDDQLGAPPVIVLSYGYWQRAFGGVADAIGRTVRLNGAPFTIAGVIDPQFTRLTPGKSLDLWIPLSQAASLNPTRNDQGRHVDDATNWWLAIIGRLKPELSLAQAQAATNLAFRNEVLHGANPLFKDADDPQVALLPAQKGLVGFRQFYDEPIYILSAAVGIVLVIVCANLAALLLARATAREKEMAVRLALGAGKGRIIQQLITESLLLSFAGAALGFSLPIGPRGLWRTLLPGMLIPHCSSTRDLTLGC